MKKTRDACRFCRKEIPQGALFCPWCGEKQVGPKKAAPKYPAFRVLADGSLLGQLMADGQRVTVKAATEEEYRARIDAIRTGVMELKKHPEKRTLEEIVRAYIDKNDKVLSPATIRGYECIIGNRFPAYMKKRVCDIDFQQMVNEEAAGKSEKTVKNAWALVASSLKAAGAPVPQVNLPSINVPDGDFLDYDAILRFLAAIRGDDAECAALLALHGLRMSELLMLDAGSIRDGFIRVRGAVVPDKNHHFVEKRQNKNRTSTRDVPVMIPRLLELIPEEGKLVTIHPSTIRTHIEKACKKAGVTVCSPHDLRRSFASLAKHLKWDAETLKRLGGWADMTTVNRIYAKLAEKDANSDIEKMKNYYQITTGGKKASDNA